MEAKDLKNIVIKETKVDTVLTKSNLPIAGYSINPYVGCPFGCKYCYATFMKRFTGHQEDWGMFLDVKMWDKIKNPEKYKGKTMIVGSVTDGYNYFESKYKRTRAFLEEMQGSKINLIITTKSNLVTRDIDLIKTYPDPLVAWSINTLDEDFKNDMDIAPSIKSRIEAMKKVHEAGIRTTCFISPIFPGITDVFSIIEEIKDYPVYLTIDLDVLDPGIMPGTGTPEAGGISFNELIDGIKKMSGLNIVAVDVNELAPNLDMSGASSALACKVVRELLLMLYR